MLYLAISICQSDRKVPSFHHLQTNATKASPLCAKTSRLERQNIFELLNFRVTRWPRGCSLYLHLRFGWKFQKIDVTLFLAFVRRKLLWRLLEFLSRSATFPDFFSGAWPLEVLDEHFSIIGPLRIHDVLTRLLDREKLDLVQKFSASLFLEKQKVMLKIESTELRIGLW